MEIPSFSQQAFDSPSIFLPHLDFPDWMRQMFINEDSSFRNPDHSHLEFADFGVLFTNHVNITKGRRIVGMAEMFNARGNKWVTERQKYQVRQWFGDIPDFIITIDAMFWAESGNPERFALIEHELYHCAQAVDEFGAPRFNQETGRPVFAIRGHDVEEFVGVVRRYGAEASGVKELIEAANQTPEIMQADIDGLCGTCKKKVA